MLLLFWFARYERALMGASPEHAKMYKYPVDFKIYGCKDIRTVIVLICRLKF